MQELLRRNVRAALYVALAAALAVNVIQILSGQYLAVVPAAVQLAVLASVYSVKSWAPIFVRLWSLLLILAGASMWLAVLVGGTSFFHSAVHASILTLALLLGLYFFVFAKSVVQVNGGAT